MASYATLADVRKRIDAICRGFDKAYPSGFHNATIIPQKGEEPNWYASPTTVGNAARLSEMREEFERVRTEMPLIDPAELP